MRSLDLPQAVIGARNSVNDAIRALPVWLVYIVSLLPGLWLFYLAVENRLGIEPIEALEHRLGLIALQFLLAGLCITPLRRFARLNLLRFRRAIGLMGFYYLCAHLLVWAVLDVQSLDRVITDILKRPYITIGMLGFVLLVPLALTSTNWAIRRLGALNWRRLHRLVYGAVIFAGLHFVMLRKGIQLEPVIYLAVATVLVGLRWYPARHG
ncbi:MAG: protein-methionine-sulfoxide reductase heme-binding subunit MsrQ [Mangrovicoccus sp.]